LREELAELHNQNSQLETKIAEMQSSGDVKTLQEEVELLGNINQLLGSENDDIRNKLNRLRSIDFPVYLRKLLLTLGQVLKKM